MGVPTLRSAQARPSAQPPIETSGNFSVPVSGGEQTNLKHFMINVIAISGDSKEFLFFPQKSTLRGPGGVPQILFHPKTYFFCDLKPRAKFCNPTITPSGRKVTRQKKRKTPLIVNT